MGRDYRIWGIIDGTGLYPAGTEPCRSLRAGLDACRPGLCVWPVADRSIGKTKGDTTAAEQATQALGKVKAVLEAAGSRLDRVLKVTVYVSDIALWSEIDAAYRAFFGGHKPARSVVPTRDLHYGFKVEVDAIAAI